MRAGFDGCDADRCALAPLEDVARILVILIDARGAQNARCQPLITPGQRLADSHGELPIRHGWRQLGSSRHVHEVQLVVKVPEMCE